MERKRVGRTVVQDHAGARVVLGPQADLVASEGVSRRSVKVVRDLPSVQLVVEDKLVVAAVPAVPVLYHLEGHAALLVLLNVLLATSDPVRAGRLVAHRPQPDVVGTFVDHDRVSAAIKPIFVTIMVRDLGVVMVRMMIMRIRVRRRLKMVRIAIVIIMVGGLRVVMAVVVPGQDACHNRKAGNGVKTDMHLGLPGVVTKRVNEVSADYLVK